MTMTMIMIMMMIMTMIVTVTIAMNTIMIIFKFMLMIMIIVIKLCRQTVKPTSCFSSQDGGRPQLLAQAPVIITVTDISDNPPKFVKSPYSEDIEENAAKVHSS